MAKPLHSSKQSVDLAQPVVRVSRIRRDPPPPVKEVSAADIREQDARSTMIGIVVMVLALVVVLAGLSTAAGWSPSQYSIQIKDSR